MFLVSLKPYPKITLYFFLDKFIPELSSPKQSRYESDNNNLMEKAGDSTPLLDLNLPPPPTQPTPSDPQCQPRDAGSDIIFQC